MCNIIGTRAADMAAARFDGISLIDGGGGGCGGGGNGDKRGGA